MKNKKERNVSTEKSNTYFSTGFAFGNLYKTTKEELNDIGAASGGSITPRELARRMAELLLAEAGGELLGNTKRLLEVRSHSTKGDETGSQTKIHVRSHEHQSLKSRETCRQCSKVFNNRSDRMYHQVEEHGMKLRGRYSKSKAKTKARAQGPVKCGICSRVFPNRSKYMEHRIRTHGYKIANEQISHKQTA